MAATAALLTAQRELDQTLNRIDGSAVTRFTQALRASQGRVFFSGQGRSGLAAQMAAMRFMHLGRDAHFVGEATAPSVRDGDSLVIVSGSGKTPVSVGFAEIAKREKAHVLLVTHEHNSPLWKIADHAVHIPAVGSTQFGGTLFEQSALILLDSIVADLMADLPDSVGTMWHNHTNLQ
jgi:6-phospho-3-hexuloisomerase